MHWTESGLCMRDGWLRADSLCCQFHPTNLFFSLNLWCKDLVPKKRKRKWSECVKCLGHGTVFMRWSESRLCTRDGWLRTDPQQGQFHPTNLFLSFNLWCKDLVPKKKGKGNAVSVLIVLATWLPLCAEQRVDFVRDGWLRADPRKSQSYPTNLLLSLYLLDAYTWSRKKRKENVGQMFRFQQLWLSSFKANLSFAAF